MGAKEVQKVTALLERYHYSDRMHCLIPGRCKSRDLSMLWQASLHRDMCVAKCEFITKHPTITFSICRLHDKVVAIAFEHVCVLKKRYHKEK